MSKSSGGPRKFSGVDRQPEAPSRNKPYSELTIKGDRQTSTVCELVDGIYRTIKRAPAISIMLEAECYKSPTGYAFSTDSKQVRSTWQPPL